MMSVAFHCQQWAHQPHGRLAALALHRYICYGVQGPQPAQAAALHQAEQQRFRLVTHMVCSGDAGCAMQAPQGLCDLGQKCIAGGACGSF